jgi:hypothetical protein
VNVISRVKEQVIFNILNWTYQFADFPTESWEKYSQELNKLWTAYSKKRIPDSAQFFIVSIENHETTFKTFCPTLYTALKDKDLIQYIYGVAFLVVPPGEKTAIHTDSGSQYIALNMPVINCEKSYTVWYKTTNKMDPGTKWAYVKEDSVLSNDKFENYLSYDSDYFEFNSSVEIDRVECTRPLWVNYKIPHRPEVEHNNLRILASFRFHNSLPVEYVK